VKNLDEINQDMVTWECDYPHSDSTWPKSPELLWDSICDLPDELIAKITHQNAMRLFSFDPFSTRPAERCTVGSLREEAGDHDISIVAHGVREDRATTIGDFANRWTK
jgi:hypothetical protein